MTAEGQYKIYSNQGKVINFNASEFYENLFISEIFKARHDFPQHFTDLTETKYKDGDPFILKQGIQSCYGKLIISGNDFKSAVCILYKKNPNISEINQLILFITCQAIEVERKRWQLQKSLERQNKTLNRLNRIKTEFLDRTSHELKTPLISIKGFTDLLLNFHSSNLDEKTLSFLQEVKNGTNRLEKIISKLLESSKLNQGKLQLNLKKENLTKLIKKSIDSLKGLSKLRNHTVINYINEDLFILMDAEKIYDVISNILNNAVKYTPIGGLIVADCCKENNFLIVSIKDNGVGLTPSEESRLFKQFGKIERYGKNMDVDIEGTGLGLYISKQIIDLHGGNIWAESEGRNKGSVFSFSLPFSNKGTKKDKLDLNT